MKNLASTASQGLGRFTESVIREQTRLAHVHGAVHLAQGFPDFPCPPELKALAARLLSSGGQGKSGNPWARLTAPWAFARRVCSRITDSVKRPSR